MKNQKDLVKVYMYKIWHGKNSGPKRKLAIVKAIIYKNLTKMKKKKLNNQAFLVKGTWERFYPDGNNVGKKKWKWKQLETVLICYIENGSGN